MVVVDLKEYQPIANFVPSREFGLVSLIINFEKNINKKIKNQN
jgi:hypothetical protein